MEILSNNNILGIIVSFVYVFSIIFLAKFLERFGKEASRKAVHILVCNWWLLAMIFFDSPIWAAVVGTSWPKQPYQLLGTEKTLSGSLTMLVASFLVTLVLLAATGQPQVLMPAITLAVLATVLEAATPLGLDNLTVPLVSAGAYYFLFVR